MPSPALIRAQIEASLADRVPSVFARRSPVEMQTTPTGVSVIDAAIGGIPCGGITEIVGPSWCSSGRKSLQSQLLAHATQEQFCALVDATDSFDPRSAQAAGVILRHLLWIRCGGQGMRALEQACEAAKLLLQRTGGFGLVIVDLSGVSAKYVRKIPLSTWFGFRGVVEKLPAALIFVTPNTVLGTCSSLTLRLSPGQIQWSQPTSKSPEHARLPVRIDFEVQITARRSFKKPSQPSRVFSAQRQWA